MTDKPDNTKVTVAAQNLPTELTRLEMRRVLQNSLYPEAKDESVDLVLDYCRATGLDVMQKPVHIVPINVKNKNGDYVYRDTIMPGIGLYRTQASRTGQYAGISEPEYGPTQILKVNDFQMEYPEWCKITIKKRDPHTHQIDEFSAKERWLENYATAKRDTTYPNAMWKKRPYAQLAKCAEAQALRKAFPELGAAMTADETYIDPESIVYDQPTTVEQPKSKKTEARPPVAPRPSSPGPLNADSANTDNSAGSPGKTDSGNMVSASAPTADAAKVADASTRTETSNGADKAGSPEPASAPESSAAQKPESVSPGTADKDGSPSSAADAGTKSKPMIAAQLRIINAKLTNAGLSIDDMTKAFGPIAELQFEDFNPIQKWIAEQQEKSE